MCVCVCICGAVRPESVMNLSVVDTTTNSISLKWTLGFDGNAEITQVSVAYITTENFATLASDTDLLQGPATTTTISGLEPHTQYNLTALAINEVGSSQPVTVQEWTQPNSE